MRALYNKGEANFPRLSTDKFFIDYENTYEFNEITHDTMKFVENTQLLDAETWALFVRQYVNNADGKGGWRGEYWGKMMRGACFVYSYTKNKALMDTLKKAVCDLLDTQDEKGRITTYTLENEFTSWDIWNRKYVLLGMQYFLEINTDKTLEERIVSSMCRQVDYLMSKLGKEEDGLLPITHASQNWYGLNSSSLLEPIVRLYNITANERYLDFANYIADEGGCFTENVFRLAEQKKLRLYQYPTTKAYEMTSCFEGLLELYRVTKVEWYKTAILNFADLILEDDFTVIGSAGCTHELFDHSTVRQANTDNCHIMQETCVTVTLMKFFLQLHLLTGDSKYIDAFEISYYNAYLGAINTEMEIGAHPFPEGVIPKAMPFDSYSPLTADVRGKIIGGFRVMEGDKFYGCCVCIGSAGIGSVAKASLLSFNEGFVQNLYLNGEIRALSPNGKPVKITTKTAYPADGKISICVENPQMDEFTLKLRHPAWCESATFSADGKPVLAKGGYADVKIEAEAVSIEINLDMPTKVIKPIPYGNQVLMTKTVWGGATNVTVPVYDEEDAAAKNNVALMRGPLMLAQDSRFGYDLSSPAHFLDKNGYVEVKKTSSDFKTLVCFDVKTENGYMKLCDYQSAGKLYSKNNKAAVWIKNK